MAQALQYKWPEFKTEPRGGENIAIYRAYFDRNIRWYIHREP